MLDYFKRNWTSVSSATDARCDERVAEICEKLNLSKISAGLLVNRGYTDCDKVKAFVEKRSELLHDPFLMKDIEKGALKLIEAVKDKKKIVIYGDYDVDGVTSVSILYLYLKKLGADISYYIPSRIGEGYGMSIAAVDKLYNEGANLIITVDTGITAIEEALYAEKLGIELIITDHHECHAEIPKACAVINPRQENCAYPFKELAGVGVVFKLICAVEKCLNPGVGMRECVGKVSLEYADLVAVGTVADVMPLKDENRLIVSYGLWLIENKPRLAIKELLSAVNVEGAKHTKKKKITSGVIGYTVAPRINAAGRIRNASIAVNLFLAENEADAARLANELCEINRERQAEENRIIEEAYEKIEREHDFENDKVIVLSDEKWHHGVIGIVSSRITEKYKCPSILISFEGGEGDIGPCDFGKGSGRSVKGMNLVDALSHCSDLLVKYGGHELAAGLTVTRENLPEFKRRINEYAKNCFCETDGKDEVTADMELGGADISMTLAKELYLFEPFGVSNPLPLFLMKDVNVDSVGNVGGGKHERLLLSKDNRVFGAMYFRHSVSETDIFENDKVDILFNLDVNNYQNKESLQFIIKDMTLSGEQLEKEISERRTYSEIVSGTFDFASASDEFIKDNVPTREEFGTVYNILKRELRFEHGTLSIRALTKLLKKAGHSYTYVKLKIIINVFRELNLLSVEETDVEREIYKFKYVFVKNKTELDKSSLYRKIKQNFGIKGM